MKKVTILALHLSYGGVEKAISSLANMICDDYDVEIISTYKIDENPAFFINDKVKVRYLLEDLKPNKEALKSSIKSLNPIRIIKEVLLSIKVLRERKRQMINNIKVLDCDIAISTRMFHNEMLGKYGDKNIKKIAWEHAHHNNNLKYIKGVVDSCKDIDFLIPVSQELTSFYQTEFTNKKCKVTHVPLCLDKISKHSSNLDTKNLVAVGRLSAEKGFIELVDIMKKVVEYDNSVVLNLVGDGQERKSIESKVKEFNLEKNFILHGYKDKEALEKIYLESDVYLMVSLEESMGLVVLEAFSYGVPVIAFDTAKGPLEIIENNSNGIIIEGRSYDKMAEEIMSVLNDRKLLTELGTSAKERAQDFSFEASKRKWLELLK